MHARLFDDVRKNVTVAQVHTPTALGNQKPKKRAKTFKEISVVYTQKQALHPNGDGTAKTPFLYDVNALGSLRPDQVPRFFGALTDADKLPVKSVKLDGLHAMQDRVDPAKVEAMRATGTADRKKKPLVVKHNGTEYIADGHHRLAADLLDGKTESEVHYKDLEPVSNALKSAPMEFRIAKVDETLGVVFGWSIVCKVDGKDYYDLNIDHAGKYAGQRVAEHITEDAMLKCALDFMENSRAGNEMHDGPDVGTYIFAWPLTTEIAKAMGLETGKTGLMVGYKPPPAVLNKFRDGTYTGFSIEGNRVHYREIEA